MHEDLTLIANSLFEILSSQQRERFNREIIVSEECGGDIEITKTKAYIHPFLFTVGDPVATMNEVLNLVKEFEKKRRAAEQSILMKARWNLRIAIRDILRVDPENAQKLIEDSLALESEDILTAEEKNG